MLVAKLLCNRVGVEENDYKITSISDIAEVQVDKFLHSQPLRPPPTITHTRDSSLTQASCSCLHMHALACAR